MLGQDETTIEKQRRLSTLLGLPNPPDRASLVKDLVSSYIGVDTTIIIVLLLVREIVPSVCPCIRYQI